MTNQEKASLRLLVKQCIEESKTMQETVTDPRLDLYKTTTIKKYYKCLKEVGK